MKIEAFSIDRFLLWAIRIVLGLILLEPLVIGSFGLTASLWPKAVFFRALVEVAFIFYVILLYRNPQQYMPRFSWLAWALVAFVAALFLSTALGITPSQSFWGDAWRTEGFIFYLHLLVFFFVAAGVFKKRSEWLLLLGGVVAVGAGTSAVAILQALHAPLPNFIFMVSPGRVSSTLANPIFFGDYISSVLFIGVFLFLENKRKLARVAIAAALALGFVALILSGTRGAWVGLGAGFAVLFGAGFVLLRASRRRVLKIGVVALLGVALAGFVLWNIPAVQDSNIFHRATNFPSSELSSRLVGWNIALDAWRERPVFGWGLESFNILFDKFFKQEYLLAIGERTFFDRAHNQVLHLLATAGIVGAGAYVFVLFAFGWIAWKSRAVFGHPFAPFAIWAFLAGSFAQNLFAFDTISTSVLFFLFAAFVHASRISAKSCPINATIVKEVRQRGFSSFLLVSYLIFALTLLWQINIKPMTATLTIIKGAKAEQEDPHKALAYYKEALTKKTVYDSSFRVAIIERLLVRIEDEADPAVKKEMAEMLAGLKPQIERDLGKLPRVHASGYELLYGMAEKIYSYSGNDTYLFEMDRVAKEAVAANPATPRFYHLAGRAAIIKGEYEKGEELHAQGYELGPKEPSDTFDYYFQLGLSYTRAGELAKSSAYMKLALEQRYALRRENLSSPYDAKAVLFAAKVAAQHCEFGDAASCLELFEKAKEAYPADREYFQVYIDAIHEKLDE